MGKTYKKISKRKFLLSCQQYAESKGGKCLSQEYINTHEKLIWQCEFGHIWEAMPSNVKRGKWCSTCSRNKKLNIQNCIEYASLKGGFCLSEEYINSATNLIWKCQYGHVWEANFNNIKSKGSWCPECSSNIGERICRIFFEQYFNKPFPKTRPEWLKTDLNSTLELDGFNVELKIAFEYQGIQHYKVDGFFIKTAQQLDKRIKDDLLKSKLCAENNIKLIVIPYLKSLVDLDVVVNSLTTILQEHDFNLNQKISIDLDRLYSNKIQKYKELALVRGGECLSDAYIDYYTKLVWRCNKDHIWEAVGYSIEKGHWCPDCAGNRKK